MKKIMYNKLTSLFCGLFLLFVGLSFCFISCIENNNVEDGENAPSNFEKYADLYDRLSMTTWTLVGASGEFDTAEKYYFNRAKGHTVTFSSEFSKDLSGSYRFYSSFFSGSRSWWITDDGRLSIYHYTDASVPAMTYDDYWTLIYGFGLKGGMVTQLDNNSLVINLDDHHTYYYKAAPYNQSGGSSGSGSGGSTTYEIPDIGLESFTCTASSITVKYRVYNQDKAKVNSAKGYYGTSSPSKSVTGSISGSLITISITGLQKGTTYHIKCSATGPGGTTTSDTTRLITNY